MCPDLFSEEAPCGLIIAKDHLQYGRKRPLSLCILGGRLREVRLYSTSNITLGIEMLTTKKKVKLFVFFASQVGVTSFTLVLLIRCSRWFFAMHPLLFLLPR